MEVLEHKQAWEHIQAVVHALFCPGLIYGQESPGWISLYKLVLIFLSKLEKNGNKVWTISKAEMTLLFSSVLHFFLFFENIQNRQFFWKN